MRVDVPRSVGLVLAGAVVLLGGCTSLSGVGGDTQYACPAPRGVQCGSVSANYLQSLRGDLPGPPPTRRAGSDPGGASAATVTPGRSAAASADSDTPLYSPPRILKLWVAHWEDRDGVLHDAAFVFVPIDHGLWLLNPVRSVQRVECRVIRPPRPDALMVPANTGTADPSSAPPRPTSPADPKDGDAH